MSTSEFSVYGQMAVLWAPRVLAALVILLVAYLAGRALKWALASGINRIPVIARQNAAAAPRETVGGQLGQLGYWLVLLVGLIAALGVLGLQGVVAPLNALVVGVTSFIPRLIGAGVIFFVGLLLAGIAQRFVESALSVAQVDRWLEKSGIGKLTGAGGLSKTLGVLVFVLIIIPVAVAALEQLGVKAISEPAVAVLSTVLDALPRLIAAAILLALAYLIGRWVAGLIEQILPSLGFDRSIQALGLRETSSPEADAKTEAGAPAPAGLAPSKIVANLALVAIILFSAVEAARLLQFAAAAQMLEEVLKLGSRVVFGGVIVTAGVLLGDLLARIIGRSVGGGDRFAATLVRWATIALAAAMGLRFMGLADEIVILAFGLILGSAAVAAALAFGLGGREAAQRLLRRWLDKQDG
ncbi:hypothetical protein C5708_06865 [Caulobacter sp. CCUG 60055]|nr:mechanosensitive ion channel [Caulobacter sp. CCUG 60055]MBQ1543128.1 mechanosensitive ion channel [Caulobacteraceae bacterium]MCI3179972.1 hypothetical protein [Caulobacter sp. CCUG 60055]